MEEDNPRAKVQSPVAKQDRQVAVQRLRDALALNRRDWIIHRWLFTTNRPTLVFNWLDQQEVIRSNWVHEVTSG